MYLAFWMMLCECSGNSSDIIYESQDYVFFLFASKISRHSHHHHHHFIE